MSPSDTLILSIRHIDYSLLICFNGQIMYQNIFEMQGLVIQVNCFRCLQVLTSNLLSKLTNIFKNFFSFYPVHPTLCFLLKYFFKWKPSPRNSFLPSEISICSKGCPHWVNNVPLTINFAIKMSIRHKNHFCNRPCLIKILL